MEYTKQRYTNIMQLVVGGDGSVRTMYSYIKPTISSCKCTFADGSTYFQKTILNDRLSNFKGEENKLYLDQECTILAPVTRKQKIHECKRRGLI